MKTVTRRAPKGKPWDHALTCPLPPSISYELLNRLREDVITYLHFVTHDLVQKPKLTPQQITHARKLIDAGERQEDVAALLNVDRTTLYRAFAS